MAEVILRELKIMIATAAVLWDLLEADQCRRTCPQRAVRDVVESR
jgi:hypothetical protein